ncbi:2-phospho-L-lactate transferase [Ensifer sp. NM-2]|uniref:2-phospho-L-lactate transferase n=1 Tax=Ensifer sp. NM-2 TaxID=2109730 RepID=UPI000D11728C|nr:2-phospho-L-lactate transferase [Ensifer sp. NM-2]PSS61924.1 2-phospho-L-lactate transferase [Ensifer sp. NM-2]
MTATEKADRKKTRIVALCGGVGGAKLALGLSRLLGSDLTVIVNTGDDFEHLGLQISPDLDTVLYTLSGLANRELGWGRADESWNFMEVLRDLGSETWFQLGDRDLALHVQRTHQLKSGRSLTSFMAEVANSFGIAAQILPMTDDTMRTTVVTTDGVMPFQRYFVERRCAPVVEKIVFDGASGTKPTAQVTAALNDPRLRAVVICPSNPFLSIDPILSVPGLRRLIEVAGVPVVAVSPIIGGKAVKGPTDKIMAELGVPTTSRAIVERYGGLLDGLVVDVADGDEVANLSIETHIVPTLMKTEADRDGLARSVLDFVDRLSMATGSREVGCR